MYRLELKYQNLAVREYRLQNGDIRFIGRAPDKHIVIDDPGVSRNHCFIIQMEEELFLGDRGSKHMTLVNGKQVICANSIMVTPSELVCIIHSRYLSSPKIAAEPYLPFIVNRKS